MDGAISCEHHEPGNHTKGVCDISVENSEEDASLEVVPGTVFSEKKSNGFRIPLFLRSSSKKQKQDPDDKAREREVLKYRDEFLISDKYDRDQKEYFIECMNKGYPFDTVKTFIGNPDLTASDMKRIMAVCGR